MAAILTWNSLVKLDDGFAPRRRNLITRWFAQCVGAGLLAMVLLLGAIVPVGAQDAKGAYPNMAPLEKYRAASSVDEIALARSAAPASISDDAEILVL
jgi:hypothetical protein